MLELRKALNAQLKIVHPRVYFQQAPASSVFPYLVYDLPSLNDDGESLELVVVDVDGWSINPDTTEIETLMAAVNTALNKQVLSTDSMTVMLYLEQKLALIDDDPTIKRRKYVYQARMFRKG